MATERNTLEQQLEAAGEKMGLLMRDSSERDKVRFRQAKHEVDELAKIVELRGSYADRSCLFASWILGDPDTINDELKNASREYIEIDHLLIRSYKTEEE